MEHSIRISPTQMKKLVKGGAITLKPSNFDPSSIHKMIVSPATSRRIGTAMKKMKGVRIALKPEEDVVQMSSGGKISLRSIGNSIKSAFSKNTGNKIASTLIHTGIPTATGAVGSVAGETLGGPLGAAFGGVAGHKAGDELANYVGTKTGYGTKKGNRRVGAVAGARLAYDALPSKGGAITLKSIGKAVSAGAKTIGKIAKHPVAKEVGKIALRQGAAVAGNAITAYTGNPIAGKAFESLAIAGGERYINSDGDLNATKKSAVREAKRIAVDEVDNYIDANLKGKEKEVAQAALAGKYPTMADAIYDYTDKKLYDYKDKYADPFYSGMGLPRRTKGGLRMGKGISVASPAFDVAMRSIQMGGMVGCGMRGYDGRSITPSYPPAGDIIQTGSPYQRINSPAMSPFLSSSPQLEGFKVGGSFLPAGGNKGGSFLPSG